MPELSVVLVFQCLACRESVQVTVRCAGTKLKLTTGTAAVEVPCPYCSQVNKLCFNPGGTVRAVSPGFSGRRVPRPSWN